MRRYSWVPNIRPPSYFFSEKFSNPPLLFRAPSLVNFSTLLEEIFKKVGAVNELLKQ